ncbi:MAG: SufS family cysteine desulfurase [Acidimicrobiia bacterium]|nr:SufS family cysteine desulfurase [Acidimicrobiia bacterium]
MNDDLGARVRGDFPILARRVNGHDLHYLDSGASSQRPAPVIDAMDDYYRRHHANIHRGAHTLGDEATQMYEDARARVASFLHARDPAEVVFTKNVTEALNLVAKAWGGANLGPGDRIVCSTMEHHANIVPWFQVAAQTGAHVEWIPLTDDGLLDMDAAARLIDGAAVVACTATSNVLGTITPIAEVCRLAAEAGALSVVDAAQLVPHMGADVEAIGCDVLGFTGHKVCGPTGIGVLWGRRELLDAMPPFLGGGEMIADVTFDGFTPAPVPLKFEAGTMPIAEAVGLHAAIDYVDAIGFDAIRAHEVELLRYAFDRLDASFGDKITVHGPRDLGVRSGIVSFTLGDVHPHDLATILDQHGVAIRAGHHCAKPLMSHLGVMATARASFYLYSNRADVDALVDGLEHALALFEI